MSRLLFFHDFASPYCRLALESVADATARASLELRPVPFELWPAPEPLPSADEPGLAAELETASELARDWGVTLRAPSTVPRTRKAHEAVAYALARGIGPDPLLDLLRGIYGALWSDGLDIARIDVLADIGEAAGLEREPLHIALGVDELQADVVREQHAAAGAGLAGVPAVQLGSVLASGLLPADELLEWIRENR